MASRAAFWSVAALPARRPALPARSSSDTRIVLNCAEEAFPLSIQVSASLEGTIPHASDRSISGHSHPGFQLNMTVDRTWRPLSLWWYVQVAFLWAVLERNASLHTFSGMRQCVALILVQPQKHMEGAPPRGKAPYPCMGMSLGR